MNRNLDIYYLKLGQDFGDQIIYWWTKHVLIQRLHAQDGQSKDHLRVHEAHVHISIKQFSEAYLKNFI